MELSVKMATMIPPSLPSKPKPTLGEEILYKTLKLKLPNDFWVWYEPVIGGKYPDFVILSPNLGLVILEVKGWRLNNINKANPGYFEINYQKDDTESVQNQQAPLLQARNYLNKLQNILKEYRVLTNPSGKHKGKLSFPIGSGAVMSHLTKDNAEANGLLQLLPEKKVIYKDELSQWGENTSPETIISQGNRT